ncbi:hypothetical protein ColLi_09137 [Colletotrichum liriopes]|uniref:Uncharacterized protein n=1 Tax=Colletotrichum liriopes TaxID=708192 RepID=A0AA37GT22_9PEZI|nr:hypothetical protein ColLi_09137 [Colletotrichum liriopes]
MSLFNPHQCSDSKSAAKQQADSALPLPLPHRERSLPHDNQGDVLDMHHISGKKHMAAHLHDLAPTQMGDDDADSVIESGLEENNSATSTSTSATSPATALSSTHRIRLDSAANLEFDLLAAAAAHSTTLPCPPFEIHSCYDDFLKLQALLPEINNVSRFGYNHTTQLALFEMGESPLHHQTQRGVSELIRQARNQARDLVRNAANGDHRLPAIAARLSRVYDAGTADIEAPGRWVYQPDFCFRERLGERYMPSILGEVSYAQGTVSVEEKALIWAESVDGSRACIVLVIDIQYRKAQRATVSMLVADCDGRGGPYWAMRGEAFYVEGTDEQPEGVVDLYISDFLGSDGLPDAFIRPYCGDANQAGFPRTAQATVTFENLREKLLEAKEIHREDQERLARAQARVQAQAQAQAQTEDAEQTQARVS